MTVSPSLDVGFDLYRSLYRIRKAEAAIIAHYPEDDMKTPMHMSMGQEAIPAGVCAALDVADQVLCSYRSHATYLARTQDTDSFFAELYGRVSGPAVGKAGSMHLALPEKGHYLSSAIVASSIPVAAGAAYANKMARNGRVACTFFGDGALDEGVFWETLNVAAAMRLPLLFVCEDNGLAVHTPSQGRQGYADITRVVSTFRCAVFDVNTTDVEVVYDVTTQALQRMHQNEGPAFMRLTCYRYLEHVGIHEDFDAGYRSREEYERWRQRDPLRLQRDRLIERTGSAAVVEALELDIDREITTSVRRAMAAPDPSPDLLYRGVFHEKP